MSCIFDRAKFLLKDQLSKQKLTVQKKFASNEYMNQYRLYVFDEFSHSSAKSPDAESKCIHTLPCSQFASLGEL